jgi:hypothetical protein
VDPHWFNGDPDPAFFLIADPDPVPNPGFDDEKLEQIYSCKTFLNFLARKLQFTYPYASINDAQATGKAFSPLQRTSSTSRHEKLEILYLFLYSG